MHWLQWYQWNWPIDIEALPVLPSGIENVWALRKITEEKEVIEASFVCENYSNKKKEKRKLNTKRLKRNVCTKKGRLYDNHKHAR